ncbi:extracellular solute-binding protein [Haloplanus pelagicus]|uniref:extracellular solute-binding protein n=1 Tax=Haloplanus pelagicus TaxID=2949995 RepID=UPI0020406BE6|nr:extracellular solute-binding protein [Haloplanus sp. HW8-1]
MDGIPVDRRGVLSALAASVGGVGGCLGVGHTADPPPTVSVLAAGSLNDALENGLRSRVDARLRVEAHGSAEVARLVAAGTKAPDIVSLSDVALFDGPLDPSWYAEFATNAVVVAYDADSEGGRRLAAAAPDRWYRPLLAEGVSLGRTDPDLDPLGYRTLFVLDLATEYYGLETDLGEAIPRREQIFPETRLVSQFETGAIDAAITYRSMAEQRGYDYVSLPPEIDLGTPRFADRYAAVSYELPSGTVVRGAPVSYGSTMRHDSAPVRAVFERAITGAYLGEFGFVVPDDYPRFTGDSPDDLAR